jgi:hypothetical protein
MKLAGIYTYLKHQCNFASMLIKHICSVLALPHDLTLPFARLVVRRRLRSVIRFSFGSVYRASPPTVSVCARLLCIMCDNRFCVDRRWEARRHASCWRHRLTLLRTINHWFATLVHYWLLLVSFVVSRYAVFHDRPIGIHSFVTLAHT